MTGRATAEAAIEPDRIGFFGKVPTHGDFVAAGLDRHLQATIDTWIQAGIHACGEHFGETWEETFAALPPWRFVLARSIWTSAPVAGVLLPSRDRVGRSFPLVIAARLASYRGELMRLCRDDTWFMAAEALAETSNKRDFDITAMTAGLKRLRLPRGNDGEDLQAQCEDADTGVWWTIDPDSRKPMGFRTRGTPTAIDFCKLLLAPGAGAKQAATVPPEPPPAQVAPSMPTPQHRPRPFHIDHSHATHCGTRLTVNADALLVSDSPALFALAGGIGGDQAAVNAAKLTVNMLAAADDHETVAAMVQEVKGKLGRAHGLLQAVPRQDNHRQVGASVAAAAFCPDGFAIAWAGHTRCYLVRDGMMRCLTRDHVEIGMRFALSRFVGSQRQLVPEVVVEEALDGDIVLICSASLPRALGERAVAQILLDTPVAQAAEVLVQDALIANAGDNVSAIVLAISS